MGRLKVKAYSADEKIKGPEQTGSGLFWLTCLIVKSFHLTAISSKTPIPRYFFRG